MFFLTAKIQIQFSSYYYESYCYPFGVLSQSIDIDTQKQLA